MRKKRFYFFCFIIMIMTPYYALAKKYEIRNYSGGPIRCMASSTHDGKHYRVLNKGEKKCLYNKAGYAIQYIACWGIDGNNMPIHTDSIVNGLSMVHHDFYYRVYDTQMDRVKSTGQICK